MVKLGKLSLYSRYMENINGNFLDIHSLGSCLTVGLTVFLVR